MSSVSSSPQEVVKKRWLGFLIWQSIVSTVIYLLLFLFFPFRRHPLATGVLSFLAFHLSVILFSFPLFFLSSPRPDPFASLPEIVAVLLRACILSVVGGASGGDWLADWRARASRTLATCFFMLICGVSGFLSAAAVCGRAYSADGMRLVGLGIGGAVFGMVYGVHYIYHRRWILKFPIIQRPLFYSFKMGLSSSLRQALKLSTLALFPSLLVMLFLPSQFKSKSSLGMFMVNQFSFYAGISVISLSWELSTHLLQVVHTRRGRFAPSKGSAAAETNPSEVLLEALELSNPGSLLQYLAYLDLCMVSENNAEPWRRAAFFEETGETYRRVVRLCLRPLEELISKLVEGLEPVEKSDFFTQQLNPTTRINICSKLHEVFNDLQLYAWCARTLAALTARSHSEDRYGVAQLSGCNVAILSSLLSALLAVEACMGKKTSMQPAKLMGPSSIRWVTPNTTKHEGAVAAIASRKRGGVLYAKAYAMADILRTSIYEIVYAFQPDMEADAKGLALEKNWIALGKPLYGTREMLIQKLHLFLGCHAY